MGFIDATRLRRIRLPVMTRPTGGGQTSIDLPKVGILHRLYLTVTGTVAGTLSAPNANGMSSILDRVRLSVNSGIDLYSISGPGYHYLLRDFIDGFLDPFPSSNARSAVTATTFDISMVLPIAVNNRDEYGLVMLQNEQTLTTLFLTWLADASVATGATVTSTAEVTMEYFEVPQDVANWPRFDLVHQVLEDTQGAAGAGEQTYYWPRGNTYLGVYHLIETTTWTQAILRAQQGNLLQNENPASAEYQFSTLHGRTGVLAGALTGNNKRVMWDFMGTDGLGSFGSVRDLIDSARLTDLASVITVAGAGTLRNVRRQLVTLGA